MGKIMRTRDPGRRLCTNEEHAAHGRLYFGGAQCLCDGDEIPDQRATPPVYVFETKGRRSFTRAQEERGGGRRQAARSKETE